MIRQDKIGYIITHFRVHGIPVQPAIDNPLGCLIREILSSPTANDRGIIASQFIKNTLPVIENVTNDDPNFLIDSIRSAGISLDKAHVIQDLLQWCQNEFGEFSLNGIQNWSDDKIINELLRIKGIGIKSAAVLLCFALQRDIFPINASIHRVLTRIGVANRMFSPGKLFSEIRFLIPYGRGFFLHTQLNIFGRSRCSSRKPVCQDCPFMHHCDYHLSKNDWAISS